MRATILAGIVALGTRSARATESASQPEGGSATEPASQPEGGAATESAAQPEGGVESVAVADALSRAGTDFSSVEDASGTQFDPTVVAAALEAVRQR